MKRTIRNDKYSDVLDFTVLGTRSLTDLVTRLFDASDSDWILGGDDKVTLLFPTVHMTKHGWDNVDGSRATKKDLGGFTLNMIDKLAWKTDVFDMWYPKDGHVGIKLNKDALKRRMKSDYMNNRSILDDMNKRNGFRDYNPADTAFDNFADWADRMKDKVLF